MRTPRPVLMIILVVLVIAAPLAAEAQQAGKAVRIGVLRPAPDGPVFRQIFEPFRQALGQSGFLEGTNLTLEWRVRAGSAEEMLAMAGELVRLNVDAILALSPDQFPHEQGLSLGDSMTDKGP